MVGEVIEEQNRLLSRSFLGHIFSKECYQMDMVKECLLNQY